MTGPAFFGPTGATGPTGPTGATSHRDTNYLLSRAKIELVGASDVMIRSKFYEVFNEFFSDSSIWQEELVGEFLPGVKKYWTAPQEELCGVIIRLDGVYDHHGCPIPAIMPNPPYVLLQNAPTVEATACIRVIKTCAIEHDTNMPRVPYWVIHEYEVYLLAGLLGRLQMQKNRAYFDPMLGRVNEGKFRGGIAIARADALRKNTFGRNAWIYPQAFRTRNQRGGVSVGSNYREF